MDMCSLEELKEMMGFPNETDNGISEFQLLCDIRKDMAAKGHHEFSLKTGLSAEAKAEQDKIYPDFKGISIETKAALCRLENAVYGFIVKETHGHHNDYTLTISWL